MPSETPGWQEAQLNAAIANWRASNIPAAHEVFEKVLAANPNSPDALRGLAALALEEQEWPRAFDLHRRLLDIGERGAEFYYNIGLICQKRNQASESVLYYQEALKQNPGFAEALLNLGHAMRSLGKEDEARACWQRAIAVRPELAASYFEPGS